MTDPLDADTRQIAFEQFARNFARALLTTPVGWLVVLGMAWGLAPTLSLWTWFGAALACWLLWAFPGIATYLPSVMYGN